MTTPNRRDQWSAAASATIGLLACALAGGCPASSSTAGVIPTLPGDGDEHVAKPGEGTPVADAPEPDPWEGRPDLLTPPAPRPPAAVALPNVARFKLTNGLEVIVVESPRLPVVTMQLAIKAGGRDVTRDKVGVDEFSAAMLTKGTRTRNAVAIANMIDYAGGSLEASSSFEVTLVTCRVLAASMQTCMTLLPDVVIRPTFPAGEMDQVRDQLLASVLQRRDNAGQLASAHFHNFLWGDEHVRGWPMSVATVGAIKRADLVGWHKAWYQPNNAVLTVAGAVKASQLKAQLNSAFWQWRRGKLPERAKYQDPQRRGSRLRLVDKPGQTQTHIRIGHLGIAHDDPRFFATQVFNYALGGGGFASRLMQVVRSDEGKAYGASSYFDRNADRGTFVAATFTRNAEATATIGLMLNEIAKMKQGGPTADEVAAAIANIAGGYGRRFESAAGVASALLAADLHGFSQQYVERYALAIGEVTAEQAAQAAAELLDPTNVTVVVVGDAKDLEPQFKAAGWNYEKVGYLEPIASYERTTATAGSPGPIDPKRTSEGVAVLDKALAAKGGEAKLRGLRTIVIKANGKIATGGRQFEAVVTRHFVSPNKVRLDIEIGGGVAVIVTTLAGKTGWGIQPQQGVADLPPEAITELEKQLWRDQEFVLLRHKDKGTVVQSLGTQDVSGRKLHVVQLTRADKTASTKLFIDPETFLLAGMTYTDQGLETVESYADYRPVQGIQIAHQRQTVNAQAQLSSSLQSVQLNVAIDPKVFAKPSE